MPSSKKIHLSRSFEIKQAVTVRAWCSFLLRPIHHRTNELNTTTCERCVYNFNAWKKRNDTKAS